MVYTHTPEMGWGYPSFGADEVGCDIFIMLTSILSVKGLGCPNIN